MLFRSRYAVVRLHGSVTKDENSDEDEDEPTLEAEMEHLCTLLDIFRTFPCRPDYRHVDTIYAHYGLLTDPRFLEFAELARPSTLIASDIHYLGTRPDLSQSLSRANAYATVTVLAMRAFFLSLFAVPLLARHFPALEGLFLYRHEAGDEVDTTQPPPWDLNASAAQGAVEALAAGAGGNQLRQVEIGATCLDWDALWLLNQVCRIWAASLKAATVLWPFLPESGEPVLSDVGRA